VPGSVTFTPVADSYVDVSIATGNKGSGLKLRVDGSPTVSTYLRFTVSGLSASVARVTLRVYANSSQSKGYDVHSVADTIWGETTITSANAPAMGAVVGSSGPATADAWTSVDVTPLITGNGTFSLGLTTLSVTALALGSRESANPPQLVVEMLPGSSLTPTSATTPAPAPTPTPTPAPTATPTPAPSPTRTPHPPHKK
jgi:hypothetical protein